MRWPEDQVADHHASRHPNTSGGEPRDGQRMELQVSMKPRTLWPANTQKEKGGKNSTTNHRKAKNMEHSFSNKVLPNNYE